MKKRASECLPKNLLCTRRWIGCGCILVGILLLIICVPEWLTALIVAMLLFMLGAALIGRK